MRRQLLGVLLVSACGRLGFDEVLPDGALALSYPTSEVDAILDTSVISLTPTARGAPEFSISPGLPNGVDIDAETGVISGTPTEVVDEVEYTITATSDAGAATFALTLVVLPGFAVRSTADLPDDDGGADTICFTAAANACTFRGAIQTANRRTTKQLILLEGATYAMDSTLPPITNDVVIVGAGADATRIHASTPNPGYGLFTLATQQSLTFKRAAAEDFGMTDGAVFHVTAGVLRVAESSFSRNQAAGSGGVLFINGGATARLETSTFTSNEAYGGCCGGWGGVIDGEDDGTSIVVSRCTATLNESAWGSFSHITTGTTLLLENSTLVNNASNTAGTLATPGGIYTLINDTIAFNTNSAGDSAGIYLFNAPCSYTVTNTIVAFNTNTNGNENNCNRRDVTTTITSNGGNLISDTGGNCATYFNNTADRLTVNPGIDQNGLADNGGPTQTIKLLAASPAIDAAKGACPELDQRGQPRPDRMQCDAGSVEMP